MASCNDLIESLGLEELERLYAEITKPLWKPFCDKPQEIAYHSYADEILYGGAAGGGKTDLLLGVALTQHRKSIIYRRDAKQCQHLEDRMLEILRNAGYKYGIDYRYNSNIKVLSTKSGRLVALGGIHHLKHLSKYQGRPRDFVGFDEATEFTGYMFKYLTTWLRTDIIGQRTRVICASNPPLTVDGRWLIDYWAPWLNPKHPKPAKPGELRWFVTTKDTEIEVNGSEPVNRDDEVLIPRSRTFIPAKVDDNPIYVETGYKAQLQSYQEPLRSIYLQGNFRASIHDDPWQVIPTIWVEEAMRRWSTSCKPDTPCTCIGVDVARGGIDNTVFAPRWGDWVGELIVTPGVKTPDAGTVAALLAPLIRDERTTVAIDAIGVGAGVVDYVRDSSEISVNALNGAAKSKARDKTGKFGFFNKRAEWHWHLRELLDPNSGHNICLPNDRELLQELTAPRYTVTPTGIKVEPKEGQVTASGVSQPGIKERLGRSPDKAEAVIYCFIQGEMSPNMYFAIDELESYSSPWSLS